MNPSFNLINSFNGVLDYDFDQEFSCSSSGCLDEICRCSKIINITIKDVDLMYMSSCIYSSFFSNSKKDKRDKKLSEIFYGGERVDLYCIHRILTNNKVWEDSNWEIEVVGGYYGEEIGKIELFNPIYEKIRKEIGEVLELETLSAKIKYVLNLEYGFLLPTLEKREFKEVEIDRDDIDFKRMNKKHITDVSQKDLSFYSKYELPLGVLSEIEGSYVIIDGFHRILSSNNKKIKVFV